MSILNCVSKAVGFVSGGASGLGAATVKRLVNNGAKIAIFDLPDACGNAEVLISELDGNIRENCLFLPGDVTDDQSIKNALLTAVEKFGPINLNVNCAGMRILNIHDQKSSIF